MCFLSTQLRRWKSVIWSLILGFLFPLSLYSNLFNPNIVRPSFSNAVSGQGAKAGYLKLAANPTAIKTNYNPAFYPANVIKYNTLGLFSGEHFFTYERFLNSYVSLGLNAGAVSLHFAQPIYRLSLRAIEGELLPGTIETLKKVQLGYSGFLIGPELRIYWPQSKLRPRGGYFGFFFTYYQNELSAEIQQIEAKDWGSCLCAYNGRFTTPSRIAAWGLQLGRQWFIPFDYDFGLVVDLNWQFGLFRHSIDLNPAIKWRPNASSGDHPSLGLPSAPDDPILYTDYQKIDPVTGTAPFIDRPLKKDIEKIQDGASYLNGVYPWISLRLHIGFAF